MLGNLNATASNMLLKRCSCHAWLLQRTTLICQDLHVFSILCTICKRDIERYWELDGTEKEKKYLRWIIESIRECCVKGETHDKLRCKEKIQMMLLTCLDNNRVILLPEREYPYISKGILKDLLLQMWKLYIYGTNSHGQHNSLHFFQNSVPSCVHIQT